MHTDAKQHVATDSVVSITEGARLAGIDRTTINRHARDGKISKHTGGGIQISELIRVYGPLKGRGDESTVDFADATDADARRAALRSQVIGDTPAWLTEHSTKLVDANLELTHQLQAKDETIQLLIESSVAERKSMIDQLRDITLMLPPPIERRTKRTGVLSRFFA